MGDLAVLALLVGFAVVAWVVVAVAARRIIIVPVRRGEVSQAKGAMLVLVGMAAFLTLVRSSPRRGLRLLPSLTASRRGHDRVHSLARSCPLTPDSNLFGGQRT